MIEQTTIQTKKYSFKEFLFQNRRNRIILWLVAAAIIIQFAIFKYLYPFASYIHGDSFSYILAANENLSINTYLIGYSKFLRLFSIFSCSDLALTAFQYLFIQASGLLLLFTIFYFYKPRRVVQIILLFFMIFNPLFLHLANLISSDGFFLGLSMIWFTLLIWIIYKATNKIIMWHAIILFMAFTVRYNAMIYPFIAIIAFWLSKLSIQKKLLGVGAYILLCGLFVCFTSYQYKKLTGYWQYSPFSGWQLANNAMYTYRFVDKIDRKPVPQKFRILDNMIRTYFDSTKDIIKHPQEALLASTAYMWTPSLPLIKYRNSLFINDSTATQLKKWATVAPLFKDYGLFIIKKYPMHFIRYFLWPNANKYYAPPIEFLESYNSGKDSVANSARRWFNYKSLIVTTRMKTKEVHILDFYPFLIAISNIVFICCFICFLLLQGFRKDVLFSKGVLLSGFVWLLNAAFSIFSTSSALRFFAFPTAITITFVLLLIERMWMIGLNSSADNFKSENQRNYSKATVSY